MSKQIFLIIINNQIMGCVVAAEAENHQQAHIHRKRFQTKVGRLKLRVKRIFLQKIQKGIQKKKDLYAKLRISNQQYQVPLADYFNQTAQYLQLEFVINSCHKQFGRTLAIEIWNMKETGNKEIAFGVVCLNDVIEHVDREDNNLVTCALNYYRKAAGTAEMEIEFEQSQWKQLSFKFCSVFIRKTSTRPRNCYAKITIGEQICESEIIKVDEESEKFIWHSDPVSFRVPDFVTEGSLQVLQKSAINDILIGQLRLDLPFLLESNGQVEIDENIDIYDTVTGSIKLLSCRSVGLTSAVSTAATDLSKLFQEPASPQKVRKKNNITSIKLIEDQGNKGRISSIMNPSKVKAKPNLNLTVEDSMLLKDRQKLKLSSVTHKNLQRPKNSSLEPEKPNNLANQKAGELKSMSELKQTNKPKQINDPEKIMESKSIQTEKIRQPSQSAANM